MNRRHLILGLVTGVALSFSSQAQTTGDYDEYGGWKKIQGQKTGFFHTQKIAGKWWLVSPEGNAFFSKGINSVHPPTGETPFQGGGAAVAAGLLHEWGMNTAGCWSDPALAKEHVAVAYRLKITGPGANKSLPDVFDPHWKSDCEREAQIQCAPFRANPWILGYFTDNERPWKHEDQAEDFVNGFLELPPSAPGYREAFKAKRGGAAVMESFREKVAEIYFRTTAAAIRKADPHHLILGCRFAGIPPLSVVKKMKGCADVISINNYKERPPVQLLREMSQSADLPVMVTEFSFKGPGGGLTESGSGPTKASQAERAAGYTGYVRELVGQNYCVGYHWFKYSENWQGVLQADGQPWPELTHAFTEFNRITESLH